MNGCGFSTFERNYMNSALAKRIKIIRREMTYATCTFNTSRLYYVIALAAFIYLAVKGNKDHVGEAFGSLCTFFFSAFAAVMADDQRDSYEERIQIMQKKQAKLEVI